MYVGQTTGKVPRPLKELKGFARVDLGPGQTKHVAVALDARAFSYFDVQSHKWVADAGDFAISVDVLRQSCHCKAK